MPDKRILLLIAGLSIFFSSCKVPCPQVSSADLEASWADLGGADPAKSYEALGKLSIAPNAVQFLTRRLKPVPLDLARLKRLIADFGSNDYAVREKASKGIEKMGDVAEPELRAALKVAAEPEAKDRLIALLDDITRNRSIPMPPGEPLRRFLAIQALEMAGTPEAKAALESHAKDAAFEGEREESKKAAERIQARMSANSPPSPSAPLPISMTNSIGMKFQYIPWGCFLMGSSANQPDRQIDEDLHPVKISKGFYLAITEVTQRQWKAVMDGRNQSGFQGDDLPVENVSWNSAVEFCRRLSAKERKKYRLPTEAEWEYACRAGSTTRFNLGDNEEAMNKAGWHYTISGEKTHPVGQKKSNAWGLYDMHGNVSEWCSDWYGSYPDSKFPSIDPIGPPTGELRVFRSGSWHVSAEGCASSFRGSLLPVIHDEFIGFRILLEPK